MLTVPPPPLGPTGYPFSRPKASCFSAGWRRLPPFLVRPPAIGFSSPERIQMVCCKHPRPPEVPPMFTRLISLFFCSGTHFRALRLHVFRLDGGDSHLFLSGHLQSASARRRESKWYAVNIHVRRKSPLCSLV